MFTRRQLLSSVSALAAGGLAALPVRGVLAQEQSTEPAGGGRGTQWPPTTTLNGSTLKWTMENGVKVFRLTAEPVIREFAPGMKVKCWGYNGTSPGPTIEAVEGDRIRILVTNHLPEHTTIHWHGILLPNGMDGVGGLNQPQIKPGETFAYEFTLNQHGTYMYHPHADEMVQMAVGMMGMFIVHPKGGEPRRIDRDYAVMLHEWAIHAGTYRPDPAIMLDFNMFTFNGKIFPAIAPFVARTGDRVRVRFGNLSMNQHPIHLHGYTFNVTATDGGPIPPSAQWPQTTVPVPVGSTRDIEFIADAPGDWAFHCHKSHHTMNAMGHDVPNTLGVNQDGIKEKIWKLLPDYMAMGEHGMAEHAEHSKHMAIPENTIPMMTGEGPFGPIEMGGMFTVLKVRDDLGPNDYSDPGWYNHPRGTVAWRV